MSSSVAMDSARIGSTGALGRRLWAILLLGGVWAWAIAGCADEWLTNPMYSYGWFVPPLMVFFAWRRLDEPVAGREPFGAPSPPSAPGAVALGAGFLALLVLPTELLRNELPDDRTNNWGLALVAVGMTLWFARWAGGWRLVRTLAFPVAFFLTAVAWPKRYETPVTIGLQDMVADVIVEVLHMMGIHALQRGTTIHLAKGPVGIAEACSGIRSMQASLMISLAVGELFFLWFARRLLLVLLAAVVAMILNVGRTLALCLIVESRGSEAMDRAHDLIGNVVLLVLPVVVWGLGSLLARSGGTVPTAPLPRRPGPDGTPPPVSYARRLWLQMKGLEWPRMPNFLPALLVGTAGFLTYHVWLAVLDVRDPPQQAPFFSARVGVDSNLEQGEVNPAVWDALSPTSGGSYLRRETSAVNGSVSLYHFFWKPAAANRWVTGHRPDICMPAGGWKKDGDVEPVDVELDGHRLRMYAFRFVDEGVRALQLWGIWRNGEPVQMDFFNNPTLEWSLLTGKSRSAVEVVSCFVAYRDGPAPVDLLRNAVVESFRYRPVKGVPAAALAGADPASASPP